MAAQDCLTAYHQDERGVILQNRTLEFQHLYMLRKRTAQYPHATNCSDCTYYLYTHTRPVSRPQIPSYMLGL